VEYVIIHWKSLTNGTSGLTVPHPSFAGFVFNSDRKFYFLIVSVMIPGLIFAKNLFRPRPGGRFIAIRDKDIAAEVIALTSPGTKSSPS